MAVVATDSIDRFAVCLCGQSHTVASKGVYVVLLVTLLFSLWRMAKMTFATTDASFDGSVTGSTLHCLNRHHPKLYLPIQN